MDVMNPESQTVMRNNLFLHEDVSKGSFSRLADSKKSFLGNDTDLRHERRKSVLWAKVIQQKLLGWGAWLTE